MTHYLVIQNTYTSLQMALYSNSARIASVEIDKTKASKDCILELQYLLESHSLSFTDLSFIAANQGPGPFTTLRVVIATINGLSFASKIPLIGINAIDAFLQEYAAQPYPNKLVILNAFGNDLYYGLQINTTYVDTGCAAKDLVLLQSSQKTGDNPILIMGNGILQCHELITTTFGNRAHFLDPNPETVSLEQIARNGLAHWNNQENISYQLQPLYFKQAFYHV